MKEILHITLPLIQDIVCRRAIPNRRLTFLSKAVNEQFPLILAIPGTFDGSCQPQAACEILNFAVEQLPLKLFLVMVLPILLQASVVVKMLVKGF